VAFVDVVPSQGAIDEDLEQSTKHDREGDGVGSGCSKRVLGRLGNEGNDALTPPSRRPSDGDSEAKEEEEVIAKGTGSVWRACQAVKDASVDAVATTGLVLGIAAESETKAVLCNTPSASTVQIEGNRRKGRLTGSRLVSPPDLGPPLPGLVGHRDALLCRLHGSSLTSLSAFESSGGIYRRGVSVQHLQRAVRLSSNLACVVHPQGLLRCHPHRLGEKPVSSVQSSPSILQRLSRGRDALCAKQPLLHHPSRGPILRQQSDARLGVIQPPHPEPHSATLVLDSIVPLVSLLRQRRLS
jgi:hypothetical protein